MPYLRFENLDMAAPNISAQCTACGKKFAAEVKPGERIDDVLLRIRREYNEHECKK